MIKKQIFQFDDSLNLISQFKDLQTSRDSEIKIKR